MEQPLVSVLMCSYNREKYIAEAIESVLASTYRNFELIIVDNCSEDKTLEIAKVYEQKDTRVKVYQNESNIGQFPNRNQAASYAHGKYLKYLDSDDIIYPHGLNVMVEAMEKYPEAGIGLSYYFKSKKINDHHLPVMVTSKESYLAHFLDGGLLFPGPSFTIVRKDIFLELNGFEDSYGVSADTQLNLKIAAMAPVVLFSNDTVYWRQHDDQLTVKQNNIKIMLERSSLYEYMLQSQNCPLNGHQIKIIRKTLKIILSRKLLFNYLCALKLSQFSYLKKQCNYSYTDLLLAIIPLKFRRKNLLNDAA